MTYYQENFLGSVPSDWSIDSNCSYESGDGFIYSGCVRANCEGFGVLSTGASWADVTIGSGEDLHIAVKTVEGNIQSGDYMVNYSIEIDEGTNTVSGELAQVPNPTANWQVFTIDLSGYEGDLITNIVINASGVGTGSPSTGYILIDCITIDTVAPSAGGSSFDFTHSLEGIPGAILT